jgi:hypothetical protein
LLIKIFENKFIDKIQNSKYLYFSNIIINEIMKDMKELNFPFKNLDIFIELLKNKKEFYYL